MTSADEDVAVGSVLKKDPYCGNTKAKLDDAYVTGITIPLKTVSIDEDAAAGDGRDWSLDVTVELDADIAFRVNP